MPELGPILPLAGLTLALLVSLRGRTAFRPRLSLQLRWPFRARTELSRRERGAQPRAHFSFQKDEAPEVVRLPIFVANPSRRKLGDVSVTLQFPRAFALSERSAKAIIDRAVTAMPAFTDEMEGVYRFLSKRKVDLTRYLATVTYEIGTLTPGERILLPEMLSFADREASFSDERYGNSGFADVLQHLRGCSAVRGLCRVTVTLAADLIRPIRRNIDVVSARGDLAESFAEALAGYRDAYWLGQPPPGRYYGPRLPFSSRYGAKLASWHTVDFVAAEPYRVTRVVPEGVYVAAFINEEGGTLGQTSVYMPGFDPLFLPRGITIADAIAWLGYRRLG